MRGDIGLAGVGEHRRELVPPDRLQRLAKGEFRVAIVDGEHHAALGNKAFRQLTHDVERDRRGLEHRAIRPFDRQPGGGRAIKSERQSAIDADADEPLTPLTLIALKLPDRQRVKKLVGENDQRPVIRQALDRGVPCRVLAAVLQGVSLRALEDRAHLDEVHVKAGGEARQRPRRAQRIRHQRAASRPEFDKTDLAGLAQRLPRHRREQTEQLAEDLADFRRGDEIPGHAEGVARHVVAMTRMPERQCHEAVDANRPIGADFRCDFDFERRHARTSG